MKILRNLLIVILLALLVYVYFIRPQSQPDFSSTSIPSQPSECPECGRYQLRAYPDSPAVFGRKDSLYPSHWENGRLVFDRSIKHNDQFGKTPIAVREGQE